MKYKLLLFVLFLFSLSAQAQINNEPGTVYLADGKEISGKISYYVDDPNNIAFYDMEGNKTAFTPDQIREVKLFNGKRFITKTYKDEWKEQDLLLQAILLTDNKISLFKQDGANTAYFVSKGDALHKLENNKLTQRTEDGSNYRNYDHQYIVTLTLLMEDRFDLTQKLQEIELEEEDLTEILTEYAEGEVSYYMVTNKKSKGEPYTSVFTQYSNYATYYGEETEKNSFGVILGLQYHFAQNGRGSLKFSFDRSAYKYETRNENVFSFSTRYQYELIQQEKFNFYINAHLFDLSWYSMENFETKTSSKGFSPVLRLSPGLGFEYKPTKNFAVFAELNHMLQMEHYPKNNSIGLKYSFIK
ncbi:outer membrane beta-barrel protein [Pontibacter mangrovi]|uniref:Porin family protein n=1 Tax=Pontibacter mangrovi TaxID=2589816 RepID=A0A501WDB8_9BACT|nr:outer membrane beta-barrel protein [Pontibacter mangrovi]TPE46094.1 porin family protein [Pontibacter mangrovi]